MTELNQSEVEVGHMSGLCPCCMRGGDDDFFSDYDSEESDLSDSPAPLEESLSTKDILDKRHEITFPQTVMAQKNTHEITSNPIKSKYFAENSKGVDSNRKEENKETSNCATSSDKFDRNTILKEIKGEKKSYDGEDNVADISRHLNNLQLQN